MSNRPTQNDETRAEIYETGPTKPATRTTTTTQRTVAAPTVDVDNTVVTPVDRVRWGSIIAGLFAALSTLLILSLIGLALLGQTYNPGDRAANFGIGTGIWGAVSALLAFLVGGYFAARTAAVRGRSNGLLNGAMVWIVGIPLLIYALSSGIGALLGTAGSAAGTALTALAPVAGEAANNPAVNNQANQETAAAAGQTAVAGVQATAQALQQQAQDPQTQQEIADGVRNAALGALLPLLLSLGAAALGGALGARPEGEDQVSLRRSTA